VTARPLVFATRNQGKLVELRQLLRDLVDARGAPIEIIDVVEAARRIGRAIPDTIEDAGTFVGNATKKAREVYAATGWPALADDSGLEVDALDGAPGVHSARFARPDSHDAAANNAKLLAALTGVPPERRTARFRAVLALVDGDTLITADGTCEGAILDTPRGGGGFGYDPLFLVTGGEQSMAELDHDAKNAVSHRGRAMRAIEAQLRAQLAI